MIAVSFMLKISIQRAKYKKGGISELDARDGENEK